MDPRFVRGLFVAHGEAVAKRFGNGIAGFTFGRGWRGGIRQGGARFGLVARRRCDEPRIRLETGRLGQPVE
ncbi:hypothetical protein L284_06540 [Novosphingobium lindaniclasticum LE124]|uniref:Uncharacterized protein n=1 Tax=Novosphingobium lindaniclasticum LE124 TaxID=1096930 RepID=T0HXR2_9SPHN|nr:hypothetical protein L284_06540 [Novosphingobium lindaniclasticum LE124]